jgi:hypothetical protein
MGWGAAIIEQGGGFIKQGVGAPSSSREKGTQFCFGQHLPCEIGLKPAQQAHRPFFGLGAGGRALCRAGRGPGPAGSWSSGRRAAGARAGGQLELGPAGSWSSGRRAGGQLELGPAGRRAGGQLELGPRATGGDTRATDQSKGACAKRLGISDGGRRAMAGLAMAGRAGPDTEAKKTRAKCPG